MNGSVPVRMLMCGESVPLINLMTLDSQRENLSSNNKLLSFNLVGYIRCPGKLYRPSSMFLHYLHNPTQVIFVGLSEVHVYADWEGGGGLLFKLRRFPTDICNACQVISTGYELFWQQQIKESTSPASQITPSIKQIIDGLLLAAFDFEGGNICWKGEKW